jgi:glutathione S-transferase
VAVISQYLADQSPASGLAAAFGTMERYQLMSALNFVATEVHKQIGALFNPALTSDMRGIQIATINRRLNTLDQMLADRSFMMGERFTVADAYLFTVLNWTHIHKIDVSQRQNIPGYMARVGSREKVKQAMREEGLSV